MSRRPMRVGSLWVATAIVALTGCTAGPDFRVPQPPAVDRYTAQDLPAATAGSPGSDGEAQRFAPGAPVDPRWWQAFGSGALDRLVEDALARNPDLQSADAALEAARALAQAQQATLWPSADLHLQPTRQSIAASTSSPLASGASIYTLHTAQLNIAYSPDLFGGGRRQVENARAQAKAQAFQREAARLTLANGVVATAIQEASTRAQRDAVREMVALAAEQLDAVRRQQAAGVSGPADVAAQEAAQAQVAALAPPLDKQLALLRDQLAVLTGRTPAEANDLPEIDLRQLRMPATLPLSLPSHLVRQRPDVRAAEAQLEAANAQIGVATAARLPSLNLTANLGISALTLGQLGRAGSGFWGVAGDLAQPLFDAGALARREEAARAGERQAAAQYRSTVLAAFQNVADTLHAIEADARALLLAQQFDAAAERSWQIARGQWQAGAVAYPAVQAAQQARVQAGLSLVQARAARHADVTALFQALGGGWWERTDLPPELVGQGR